MICRGIVEEIISKYQVRVRIPIIHQIENTAQFILDADLPVASICTSPNTHLNLSVGDVVIVGFENQDLGRPIILGYLYTGEFSNTAASQIFNSIDVVSDAKLPASTVIGSVSSDELRRLSGLRDNLQGQLDVMKLDIDSLRSFSNELLRSTNSLNQKLFEFSLDTIKNEYICLRLKESAYDIEIPEMIGTRYVTKIAEEAFKESSITSVIIPKTINYISPQAFSTCSMLEKVTLCSDFVDINYDAFAACPENIFNRYSDSSYIGDDNNPYKALIHAATIDGSFSIHPQTLIIASCAFYTSSLTSLELPNNLKVISNSAFSQCINLNTIIIPTSLTFIGAYAFLNCTSLSKIYYRGSEDQWNSVEKTEYWNVSLPDNVEIIYNYT